MAEFPFDKLTVENCRVDQSSTSSAANSCNTGTDVPGVDPRCADPAFRKANPELCKNFPLLVIKPAVLSLCQLQSRKLSVFLYANSTEVEITSGLKWSSSNQGVVVIGANSGKVTGLTEGIATVSASWQDLTAFTQITVMPADCCDDAKVGMELVVDNSLSMTSAFNGQYATKLAYARALAYRFVSELNTVKDVMGLMTFSDAGSIVLPLGNDVPLLKNKVTAIASTTKSTNIADALSDAIAELDADTTLSRKVVVLFTDGENHGADDPVAIADEFEDRGGVLVVVGIRSFGDGYDLLNQIATGGFFLNAHSTSFTATFDLLSGLKGYLCAGNCTPAGDITINRAALNYSNFTNWDVAGVVDLIGGTPPYELFDLLPGNDLYVDLAGSGPIYLGKLTSKTSFDFEPGNTYRLSFRMAGNQRELGEGYVARIQVIGIVDEQIAEGENDFNWDTPFTDFYYEFTVGSSTSAKISFEQISSFTAAFGELLDSVALIRDPAGTPVTMFSDDFSDENSVYIPPRCGPSAVLGSGYGYDCYGTGCLTDPVPVQVEDPLPAPDMIEADAGTVTGGVGAGGNSNSGSFDPAGMFPTYAYLESELAKYLRLTGGTMTGFITLHAEPTSPLHAATKAYVDSAISGGGVFVEAAGDTMTGDLLMQNVRLGFGPSSGAADAFLVRDSANTLALKNGTNANGLNVYKQVVAGDYERLHLGWSGTVAYLRTQASGGAFIVRTLELNSVLSLSATAAISSVPLSFSGIDHAGVQLNSLTTTERDLLTPVNGMLLYNSTLGVAQLREAGAWISLGTGGGAVDSVNGQTGVVVLNSSDISEVTNLYFTEARVLGTDLAGLDTGLTGAVTASDTVLQAFGRLQNQVGAVVSPPFADTTAIIKGSVDASKLLRFEVGGFTPATTRVLTPPDSDGTLALLGLAQTWSATQTHSALITFSGTNHSGLRLQRLSTTLRNALTAVSGYIIHNTNTDHVEFVNAALAWVGLAKLTGATLTGQLNFTGTTHAGLKLNTLTSAERDALTPAAGMFIYNTDTASFEGFGSAWGSVGAGAPFTDSSALIKGSADDTKLMRFEIDGLAPATTRVLTVPDANFTLAGINIAQTWTQTQTMAAIDAMGDVIVFGNLGVNGFDDPQTALGVLMLGESTGPTGAPTGGGILWSHTDGMLHYRGPTGGDINISGGLPPYTGTVMLGTNVRIKDGNLQILNAETSKWNTITVTGAELDEIVGTGLAET